MLRLFQITEYQLNEIADYQAIEPPSRQAVCRWASEHMDFLQTFVPQGYPRTIEGETVTPLSYVAPILAACTTFFVILTACTINHEREEEAVKLAQIAFLRLLLAGSFLISIGSILTGMSAGSFTCIGSIWLVNIGYTLELVPLIVKVAAICKLVEAARRLQRVVVERQKLFGAVASVLFVVLHLPAMMAAPL